LTPNLVHIIFWSNGEHLFTLVVNMRTLQWTKETTPSFFLNSLDHAYGDFAEIVQRYFWSFVFDIICYKKYNKDCLFHSINIIFLIVCSPTKFEKEQIKVCGFIPISITSSILFKGLSILPKPHNWFYLYVFRYEIVSISIIKSAAYVQLIPKPYQSRHTHSKSLPPFVIDFINFTWNI
jgi:hypothetical protein